MLGLVIALGMLPVTLAVEAKPTLSAARPPQRVLILHSERLELPGSESLDIARFPGESQRRLQRDYLRRRYAGRPPDVIITLGEPTRDFLMGHRQALFPDTPVVASRMGVAAQPPRSWITGVAISSQMRTTFDLILRLHPDTRRIVIVAGASVTDRRWAEQAKQELQEVATALEVVDLGELTMAGILEAVARQPPRTVLFYLHVLQDAAGQLFVPRQALDRIAQVANAPIYGRYETFVGHGIVGGHVYSFEAHGARIDERLLPPGSVVQFRESSIWNLYKWHVVGAIGLIVVQSALIAGLLVNRARRRAAEREARRQRVELAHVLRTATLGELTASLAHELSQPLTAIAANTQAALRLLSVSGNPTRRGRRGPDRHRGRRPARRADRPQAALAVPQGGRGGRPGGRAVRARS